MSTCVFYVITIFIIQYIWDTEFTYIHLPGIFTSVAIHFYHRDQSFGICNVFCLSDLVSLASFMLVHFQKPSFGLNGLQVW